VLSFVENLPIGRKIAGVTGALLGLFAIALVGTLVMMGRADGQFAEAARYQALVAAAQSIPEEQLTQRSLQAEFVVFGDEALLKDFEASAERADAGRNRIIAAFPGNDVIKKAVTTAGALDEKHDATVFDVIAPAVERGDMKAARAGEEAAKGYVVGQIDQGRIVLAEVESRAEAAQSSANSALGQARAFLIVFTVLALGVGVALSLLLTRVVARPILAIKARMEEIADGDGDLTQRVEEDRADEIGGLGKAFNRFAGGVHASLTTLRARMEEIADGDGDLTQRVDEGRDDEFGRLGGAFNRFVSQIQDTCRQVATATESLGATARQMAATSEHAGQGVGEIAATMDEVARGAGVQSSSTQEATTAMARIAEGTERAADAGRQAAAAAEEADRSASQGAETLADVVNAMNRIEASVGGAASAVEGLGTRGEAIGQIVATITDIAAQTNLLALNAAIEAARAGEQGRGFAVVADEVRKLAEESQEAAGSIAGLISEIQAETRHAVETMEAGRADLEGGSQTVTAASRAFAEIREHVAKVVGEVERVTVVADELTESTTQVGDQISHVAAVSEENAAAAQEVAAASAETSASMEDVGRTAGDMGVATEELGRLIGRFRI
jgi:methyl-accepting chemotaxis protein